MAAVSAANKNILNKMNRSAKKVGLGTILNLTSHKVIAAGEHTSAGGDATESITATGVLSTDFAIAVLKTAGAVPRTITTTAAATDAVTVVLSGDPSTDHVITYMVLRAL